MPISYCSAVSEQDLKQILTLQQANHASSISAEQAERDGFVTVMHSFKLMQQMNDAAPQIVAKDGGQVVGYALVMLKAFEDMIPILKPMFQRLSTIQYRKRKITDYTFYVMGQICIAENYRGQGLFDALYKKHKELYGSQYELCITSVATRNTRSMRAHERISFKTVNTFRDATDEWNILVWDFQARNDEI